MHFSVDRDVFSILHQKYHFSNKYFATPCSVRFLTHSGIFFGAFLVLTNSEHSIYIPDDSYYRIQRIDIAGRDVTRYLRLLLRKEGHIFHRTSEFEVVREIKEQRCKLLSNTVKEEVNDLTKVGLMHAYVCIYIWTI